MKNVLMTIILLMAMSTTAHAWFEEAAPSGNGGSAQTSQTWSWTSMKQAVVQKVTTWWNQRNNQTNGPANTPAQQPSNEPGQQAAQQTAQQPAAAQQPNTKESLFDRWNPFANRVPSNAASSAASNAADVNGSPDHHVAPEVNMKTAATKIKQIQVARVAQPAVPSTDKRLVMGRNNIPVFEFKKFKARAPGKAKKVPLLDVGTEAVLETKPFENVSVIPFPAVPFEAPKVLATPPLLTQLQFKEYLGVPVVAAAPAENIVVPVLEPEKKVTSDKIAKLVYETKADQPVTPLPVTKIAEEDLKLLRGLILFEKKDQCHVAAGIFSDLLESKRPEVAESSRYHLGVCLHEMNLPTEALHHLLKVIRDNDSKFTAESVKVVLDDLQAQHEDEVIEALMNVDAKYIPEKSFAQVQYLRAKHQLKKGHPEKALEAAVKVPQGSPFFYKSQYVAAVAEYELGRVDASLERQKAAAQDLAKHGGDKDVLALFEMNIGRTAFTKGKYKDAMEAFQKVPKESTLWMEALMELGWVQLQSKDTSGAVGNMHSIQSPYFNGVFKPESYVVRAIGYLNICQYGDAFRSVGTLEHQYAPWLEKIDQFNKTHGGDQTYQAVIKMLSDKKPQDVDGLPFQVLREIAHQRDFLNTQEALNQMIDESSGYAFIKNLIEKDKRAMQARRTATVAKIAELNAKIKTARTTPDAMKNFNAWRFELANYQDFLTTFEFKMKTMNEGEEGLTRMTPKAQERIAARKQQFKERAGKILKEHMTKIAKNLRQQLDNNELLKYEIFAGSGENLRYQIAGGKTGGNSKNSVERKPTGMKWDFDGEYWEDEIGHYRSSLKNNCQTQVAGQK